MTVPACSLGSTNGERGPKMANGGYEVLEMRFSVLPDRTEAFVYCQGVPGTDFPPMIEGWYGKSFPVDVPTSDIMVRMAGTDHFLYWDRRAPDPGENAKETLRAVLDRYASDLGAAYARICQLTEQSPGPLPWGNTLQWLGEIREKILQRPSTS